jgi:signal transduction histidine kinase/ActR/RegA family two-component response regulator
MYFSATESMRSKTLIIALTFLTISACNFGSDEKTASTEAYEQMHRKVDSIYLLDRDRDASLRYMDSVLSTLPPLSIKDKYRMYDFKRYFWANNTSLPSAYADSMLWVIRDHISDREFINEYANALYVKGAILMEKGVYSEALKYYYNARQAIGVNEDFCLLSGYTIMLGQVYYRQEKYRDALQYFLLSLQELSNCSPSHSKFIETQLRLNSIGICYTRSGLPDSGLYYFNSTLNYLKQEENKYPDNPSHKGFVEIARGVVYGNMGDAYLLKGDTPLAENLYRESIQINTKKKNDFRDAQLTQIKLAYLYLSESKFPQAQQVIRQFESSFANLPYDLQIAEKWHQLQWQYYDKTQQIAKAYQYMQSYLHLKDSLYPGKQISEVDIAHEYERIQHESDIKLLESKDALKTTSLIVTIFFAIMSILIALLIGRNWKRAKRNELELIRAKNMAEDAANAKQQFLSNMSHEIRTPLNAIIGMTYLLLQENPTAEQKTNLNTLKFSGENLLAIINDILDYSKIEAGKIAFENIDFSLKQLINNLEQAHHLKAEEKGLSLLVGIDSSVPDIVIGDPGRLAQILNNLLSNAIKFTQAGMVRIDVKADPESSQDLNIRFMVTDTGIGIKSEQKDFIFDSFTQATTDTSRHFGGTGLGLAITKRLLELQGSEIIVESEPGKGSVFSFVLRFRKSITAQKDLHLPYDGSAMEFEPLPGYRVLIVDDSDINILVARKFLSKWSLIVDHANSGQEAIEKIRKLSYDLILMDLQMPGMDGYETSMMIRSLPDDKYKQVPIIALSADVMMETRERVTREGMNDYVSKPFNPNELYSKIAKYLHKE